MTEKERARDSVGWLTVGKELTWHNWRVPSSRRVRVAMTTTGEPISSHDGAGAGPGPGASLDCGVKVKATLMMGSQPGPSRDR